MRKTKSNISKVGWHFDNTYSKLPDTMMSRLLPVPVKAPKLVVINNALSKELGLDFSNISNENLALMFSGNLLPEGTETIAQAYAGHQFGYFTILGDGRAIIIGEHLSKNKKRFDIQFKGSGKTPYSRNADGRAALGPMIREYIISEAMHGLNIPTTRSLAVVNTGENVIRETPLPGAILTRVAASHIRVGTFQYLVATGDEKNLKTLVDYTIERHYPNIETSDNPALDLLKIVIKKQIDLVTNWMRVGFIHGVMNTDNMVISGETIDYGPCAFMNSYNPSTVFSSIDLKGRYSFGNQPLIAHWNLSRFAETLIPLINNSEKNSIKIGSQIINEFSENFKKAWTEMMKSKLGFINTQSEDEKFIKNLLDWMEINKADYTNTFCILMDEEGYNTEIYERKSFKIIKNEFNKRIQKNKIKPDLSNNIMRSNNPLVIPRNHHVEESLKQIVKNNDYKLFENILDNMKNPYKKNLNKNKFKQPPTHNYDNEYRTFCGT